MKEISNLVLIESNALGDLCKNLRESIGDWYWETFFSMPVLLYMYTVMSQVAARILKSKDFNFK